MIDTTEHEAAVKTLKDQREVLFRKLRKVDHELRQMHSKNFIEANNISHSDVEMSSGDDRPWFGDVYKFGDWIRRSNSSKRFAEWNARLYYISDLKAGKFKPTPGNVDDIPT